MEAEKTNPFWKYKPFAEMTHEEWESLCDGCALCCLFKLEDEDTGEIYYTSVACRFLAMHRCECKIYPERSQRVPTCVVLTPDNVGKIPWMPPTCAYRLLAEGKDLPWWHPLVSGSKETVHTAGKSARSRAISERGVDLDKLENYVVDWMD